MGHVTSASATDIYRLAAIIDECQTTYAGIPLRARTARWGDDSAFCRRMPKGERLAMAELLLKRFSPLSRKPR